MARLVGVGVGPGDPELLTLKAARVIREADVVFAPVRRPGGRCLALEIVADLIDRERQTVVSLPFPASTPASVHDRSGPWDGVARAVLAALGESGRGVFLTEGDPLLFGSFGHAVTALRALGTDIDVEIVPGVSSVTAAAAAAGVVLTDYDDRLAIVPATTDLGEIERALLDFDCVVLLKVGPVLDAILGLLDRLGLIRRAVYVRRCGWPDQQIVSDVRTLLPCPPRDYFALLIVHKE